MNTLEGIVADLDETTYHAHPALSSTGARELLKAPAKFRQMRDHPKPFKKVFDIGTSVHSKVLGTGPQIVAIPANVLASNGAASTTAAKDFIATARAAGAVPVKEAEAAEINAMVEAVLSHPLARSLFEQPGQAEASVFATDPDTDVDMRARFDYLAPICVDLKTARDASPAGFERAVREHRYDVQAEHYLKALELVTGERRPFHFVAVESTAPYLVGVYTLNDQWQEIGDVWATHARTLYRMCTDAVSWPGYGTEIHELIPPMGLIYEHQARFENAGMVI